VADLTPDQIEKIKQFGSGQDEIAAVYVFGSVARGKARKKSDIDIALITETKLPAIKRMEMENALSNRLGKEVDLVVFHQASPLLQHQILKHGRLVYEANPKERVRQSVFARNAYFDSACLYRKLKRDRPANG